MGLSRDPLLTAGVPDRLSCTAAWGDDIVKFLLWMCWCWEWVGVSGFNRVPDRVPGKVPGKVPGRVQNENTKKHRHLHFRNPCGQWWGHFSKMDKFLEGGKGARVG